MNVKWKRAPFRFLPKSVKILRSEFSCFVVTEAWSRRIFMLVYTCRFPSTPLSVRFYFACNFNRTNIRTVPVLIRSENQRTVQGQLLETVPFAHTSFASSPPIHQPCELIPSEVLCWFGWAVMRNFGIIFRTAPILAIQQTEPPAGQASWESSLQVIGWTPTYLSQNLSTEIKVVNYLTVGALWLRLCNEVKASQRTEPSSR